MAALHNPRIVPRPPRKADAQQRLVALGCATMAPMAKTDELDRNLAAAYAWRLFKPGEALDAPTAAPPPEGAELGDEEDEAPSISLEEGDEGEVTPGEVQRLREEAFHAVSALADEIDRAWRLPESAQFEAAATLVARAAEMGVGLCAIQHFPRQSVRLLRLVVRGRDRISPETHEAACASAFWLDYSHREVVDLLAEIAMAGDLGLADTLWISLHDRGRAIARIPGASGRFARLLDEAPTFTGRRIAIKWLHLASDRQAIPPLRRALRLPHFSVRFRALTLLNERFPSAIEPDDLLFLLEDALAHPPPEIFSSEENRRANASFPDELERAILHVKPARAHEPLARIAAGDSAPRLYFLGGLDATWGLKVLAAAYPEKAIARIDQGLRRVEWSRREQATEAAGRLPDALAWPRLLMAAADPVPSIAARAQQIWLDRRGALCPLDELTGVETVWLEGPPSERMRSRLAVLRRASLEARAAMVEVLLGEAPDPEALSLLLFAMGDSGLWDGKPRPSLPTSRKAFSAAIVAGFGALGVEGLCALDARYPQGRWGVLSSIADLITEKVELPEAAFPALRAAAVRRFTEASEGVEYGVLNILAKVGAPCELFERLWSIARDADEESFIRHGAVNALASLPMSEAELGGAIIAEMEAALAARELSRFARAAAAGVRCRLPSAALLVERALDHYGPLPEADVSLTDALETCALELFRDAGPPEGWMARALGRPGTHGFAIAARRAGRQAMVAFVPTLREALSSDLPAAAAEAAAALVEMRAIEVEDPQLAAIAARSPLALRAELLWAMLFAKASPVGLWPLIEEILISADPDVSGRFHHMMFTLGRGGVAEELRAVRPRVLDPVLCEDLDEWLDLESEDEEEEYWKDEEDEDDG